MSDIPVELVWDILTRLPVESLLRFRSACKTWCQIIDDPAFIKYHFRLQQNDQNHHLVFKTHPTTFRMLPLAALYYSPSVTEKAKTREIQKSVFDIFETSCHGLILLFSRCNNFDMSLWNPSTRERLELPRLDNAAFGCQNWQTMSRGMGYDEANDDYKVIAIEKVKLAGHSNLKPRTFVYSLNSRNWSMISEEDDCAKCYPRWEGVFAKGELHWIAQLWKDEHRIILSFNLSTNTYRVVSLPEVFQQQNILYSHSSRLHVFDECLFVTSCSMGKAYKMESCGSWSQVFPFTDAALITNDSLTPIAYLKSEQQFLFVYFNCNTKTNEFTWFDIHSKEAKTVTTSDVDLPACGYDAQVIQTSLVRLNRSANK